VEQLDGPADPPRPHPSDDQLLQPEIIRRAAPRVELVCPYSAAGAEPVSLPNRTDMPMSE